MKLTITALAVVLASSVLVGPSVANEHAALRGRNPTVDTVARRAKKKKASKDGANKTAGTKTGGKTKTGSKTEGTNKAVEDALNKAGTTGVAVYGGGFNQAGVVAEVENPNRADFASCTPGQFTQSYVIDAQKRQYPTSVSHADQCSDACDCQGRCCSNWFYFITTESFYGQETAPGGVCVTVSDQFTWAAEDPACGYGISKLADSTIVPSDDEDAVIP